MVMAMAITITMEARRLKSNNNIERVLLYGQKQHLCVEIMYFMIDDSVDEVGGFGEYENKLRRVSIF